MANSLLITKSASKLPIDEEVTIASTWEQFNSKFPTEEGCIEELHRRINNDGGAKCSKCGSSQAEKYQRRRVIRCTHCRKEIWLTSGTFFHRIRCARAWLAAIYFMENGVTISSSRFQKLLGIAYSSAWTIFMKLTMVIESQMDEDAGCVSSALFEHLFCKRSRETPARRAPVAEQEEIEKELLVNGTAVQSVNGEESNPSMHTAKGTEHSCETSCQPSTKSVSPNQEELEKASPGSELNQAEKAVYEILSEEPVRFDELCGLVGMRAEKLSAALTMLELAELAERMPGDRYVRGSPRPNKKLGNKFIGSPGSLPESTMMDVGKIINFVRAKFQGISRKYLQNYLAVYWCQMNRNRWQKGSLLKLCFQFRAITYSEILECVSPQLVKVSC